MKRPWIFLFLLLCLSCPALSETIELDVPLYLQKDARWADVLLSPKSQSGRTIGQAGCTLCALASVESLRRSSPIQPDAMLDELEMDLRDELHWPRDYEALANSREGLLVRQAAPILLACLRRGRPVLMGLYSKKLGHHWVVIYGCRDLDPDNPQTAHFLIRDPGTKWRTTLNETKEHFPEIRILRTYGVDEELRVLAEKAVHP